MAKSRSTLPSVTSRINKDAINQFLFGGSTPLYVMVLAALVGLMAGLLGTGFDMAVHFVSQTRTEWLKEEVTHVVPLWASAIAVSALLAAFGYYIVHRFAPEAAGSGIQEIEGAMDNMRPVRWWRVIPVKFLGGMGTLGSGMVLGREGPTVQMGGAVGRMVTDVLKLKNDDVKHSLLASGAAGGLAAAFNAPLAGIMFVIEEMRPQFRYSLISVRAVIISAVMADIVYRVFKGQHAEILIPQYQAPPLMTLWLFLLLGALFGVFGACFNRLITLSQDWFAQFHQNRLSRYLLLGASLGGLFGLLLLYLPELTGGGVQLIDHVIAGEYGIGLMLLLFAGRIITTLICFCSGAPGGVFAPMLALGTLFGYSFGAAANLFFPSLGIEPGMFAIAGMGALFAASVRAPITGILLVIEMTSNYYLILPLIITSLGAVVIAQLCGGEPLYSQLLKRCLKNDKLQQQDLPEHKSN